VNNESASKGAPEPAPATGDSTGSTDKKLVIRAGDVPLTWYCTGCGKPIADGKGWIEVDNGRAYEVMTLDAEYSREHGGLIDLADWMRVIPEAPDWHAWHKACDPDIDRSGYWIDVARINTLAKLVHWAGHLGGKNWIGHTNWNQVLEDIGEYA
jgi:hypothetical protein